MAKWIRSGLLSLIAVAVFIAGCAQEAAVFKVRVSSLARADSVVKRAYVLLPRNKGESAADLQFQEYAGYVHRALTSRGLVHARRIEDADIAVFLSYGIIDPQTHYYTYALPVLGQTGYSGSSTYGTLSTFGGYGTYSWVARTLPAWLVERMTAQK